jgi:hypothetical protein
MWSMKRALLLALVAVALAVVPGASAGDAECEGARLI